MSPAPAPLAPTLAAPTLAARVLLAGLTLLLAACEGDRKGDPNLAVACALRACECVPDRGLFPSGKAEAVLWQTNGDAFCREGYALRLASEPDPPSGRGPRDPKGGIRIDIPKPSF